MPNKRRALTATERARLHSEICVPLDCSHLQKYLRHERLHDATKDKTSESCCYFLLFFPVNCFDQLFFHSNWLSELSLCCICKCGFCYVSWGNLHNLSYSLFEGASAIRTMPSDLTLEGPIRSL